MTLKQVSIEKEVILEFGICSGKISRVDEKYVC